ncbi:MAG: Uma2 family endonuclease [Desulfobacterales bacterium]|nr:Uma2 family endonuclease [Desulfobacterales bacterium]
MNWEQVCNDSNLQDLPYKIELNDWGQIVMSPASIKHVIYQDCITDLIKSMQKSGRTLQEFPVETSENVKAPDVVWISDELLQKVKDKVSSPIAPEICVEVMSPGNTKEQLFRKGKLYFEAGAKEFWVCDQNGNMFFCEQNGQKELSVLMPQFPVKIEI